MGDFNAKVGSTANDDHIRKTLGKYGLGERNDRGSRMIQFAIDWKLSIANTMFKQHSRRLSTWTSPNRMHKNQIDYIMVQERWRSSCRNVTVKPGAECGSDHKLLVLKFKISLQTQGKQNKDRKRTLNNKKLFEREIAQHLEIGDEDSAQGKWVKLKETIRKVHGKMKKEEKPKVNKHWFSEETIALIEERRSLNRNEANYEQKRKILTRKIVRFARKDKNDFISAVCDEIQSHTEKNETRDLFRKVKLLSREFKMRAMTIKNSEGELKTDPQEVAEAWKQYCEKLYQAEEGSVGNDETGQEVQPLEYKQEPKILKNNRPQVQME